MHGDRYSCNELLTARYGTGPLTVRLSVPTSGVRTRSSVRTTSKLFSTSRLEAIGSAPPASYFQESPSDERAVLRRTKEPPGQPAALIRVQVQACVQAAGRRRVCAAHTCRRCHLPRRQQCTAAHAQPRLRLAVPRAASELPLQRRAGAVRARAVGHDPRRRHGPPRVLDRKVLLLLLEGR